MKIIFKINKQRFLEFVLAFMFLIPFFSINFIRTNLNFQINNFKIQSNLLITILFIVFFILLLIVKNKKHTRNIRILRNTILLKIIFDIILLTITIFKALPTNNYLTQFLWLTTPINFSLLFIYVVKVYNASFDKIIRMGLILLVIYVILNLVINYLFYGFSFGDSRTISTGGGPVIYGYTITLVLAFLLSFKYLFNKGELFVCVLVLLIGSLSTGSRASILPFFLILFISFFLNKKISVLYKIGAVCFIVIIVFLGKDLIISLIPRLGNLTDSTRTGTAINSIKIFNNFSFIEKLFGKGLSGFFPYQAWLKSTSRWDEFLQYNMFYHKSYLLLVQPHNSFIFSLLELGIFGTFILFLPIVCLFIKFALKKKYDKMIFVFTFIFLNLFDAVIFINPESSSLWWLLLMLIALPQKGGNLKYSREMSIIT